MLSNGLVFAPLELLLALAGDGFVDSLGGAVSRLKKVSDWSSNDYDVVPTASTVSSACPVWPSIGGAIFFLLRVTGPVVLVVSFVLVALTALGFFLGITMSKTTRTSTTIKTMRQRKSKRTENENFVSEAGGQR
jgi:hypothetical protein